MQVSNRLFSVVLITLCLGIFILMLGNRTCVSQHDGKEKTSLENSKIYEQLETKLLKEIVAHFKTEKPVVQQGVLAPASTNENTGLYKMEEDLVKYLQETNTKCNNMKRMGASADGGWYFCIDPPFVPKKDNCLVYSFGIARDWTFDDHMVRDYGCTVHSFDPSTKAPEKRGEKITFHAIGLDGKDTDSGKYGWKMRTLKTFREMFGHTNTIIDALKMDIEGSEFDAMPTLVKDGQLKTVKQLMIEVHPEQFKIWTLEHMTLINDVLKSIESEGFKKYHVDLNKHCMRPSKRTNKTVCFCYEMYYINTKFL